MRRTGAGSSHPDPDLQSYTLRLLESLNYTGIGCAQYLVDGTTGKVAFLEINPRVAGNHAVPEHCGLDLTNTMMELTLSGKPAETKLKFGRIGVRYTWLAGDLEGLKLALRNREVGLAARQTSSIRPNWPTGQAKANLTLP